MVEQFDHVEHAAQLAHDSRFCARFQQGRGRHPECHHQGAEDDADQAERKGADLGASPPQLAGLKLMRMERH